MREIDATTGEVTYRKETFEEKIVNDQTILVSDVFLKWKREQGITW